MTKIMDLQHIHTLEEIIANAQDDQFPNNMGKKHYERYTELKSKFASRFDVELGAMATGIEEWITKTATEVEAINQLPDKSERTRKLADIFANDPIIFLNRHDGSHISMVQEKTLQILRCFNSEQLTTYEIYIATPCLYPAFPFVLANSSESGSNSLSIPWAGLGLGSSWKGAHRAFWRLCALDFSRRSAAR